MKSFKQLTKDFDYVNSDIEQNFPLTPLRSSEYKLYRFDRDITSEEAEKEMSKDGYAPATLAELLHWKDWNGEDWVVALGSVAMVGGGRRVPCLSRGGSERYLNLDWRGSAWPRDCRFLAVRSVSQVSAPDALDLGLLARVERLERIVAGIGRAVEGDTGV